MYRHRRRMLLLLAVGATALFAVPHAFAANSHIEAACTDQGTFHVEDSPIGGVSYANDWPDHGVDLAANALDLSARARSWADGLTTTTDRLCNAYAGFENTLTVGAGSTGLPEGAPVTLDLTVGVDGGFNLGYDGPGSPDEEPAAFAARAALAAIVVVMRDHDQLAYFNAFAEHRQWSQIAGDAFPNGAVFDTDHWNWTFTSNHGDSQGGDDGVTGDGELCSAWPVAFPCGVAAGPPPTTQPGYLGQHVVVIDAHVGDELDIQGSLAAGPEALQAHADASFPAGGAGSGLKASVRPGDGFGGLRLDLEAGPPESGAPQLSLDDAQVTEGDSGTTPMSFTLHLSQPSDSPVSVNYETYNGTATQPSDYLPASGTVTFAPGETEKTITVDVVGDPTPEADETFGIELNTVVGATIAHGAHGTILDDDGATATPNVSVGDASVVEGNDGITNAQVTVQLSAPAKAQVWADWATSDGTAIAPGDYTASSATLLIPIGQSSGTIEVPVVGDIHNEGDETFTVALSNIRGATLVGSGRSTVTIKDDDQCTKTITYDFVEAEGCFVPDTGTAVASSSTVRLDGLELVPNPGAQIVVDQATRHIFSRGFVSIRSGDFEAWKGAFDWHTPLLGSADAVAVDRFLISPLDSRTLKGLKVGGAIGDGIALQFDLHHEAMLTVPVGLPLIGGGITADGTKFTGTAVLVSDNARGLHSDSLKVTADAIPVPPVLVKNLAVSYDDVRDRWEGSATVVIPTPTMLSVSAGFAFQNGAFAGANADVENLNIPIGNGVYLQAIRFSIAFDPLQVGGGIGLSAGPIVDGKTALSLDGNFALDFGDPFSVEANGTLKLGDVRVASAYFRYLSTGTVTFGGQVGLGLPDTNADPTTQPVHFVTSLDGWVNGSTGFEARGTSDVDILGAHIVGADVLVSNIGLAACGQILWLKAGFGYRWATHQLALLGGDACDVGAYAPPAPVGRVATSAAPAAAQSFRLPQSPDGVILQVHGSTGAPDVSLHGPGGLAVTTPVGTDTSLVNDEFVVLKDEADDTTLVAIRHPAGSWTLTPAPGSPAVTSVQSASVGADPQVTASIRTDDRRERLTWHAMTQSGDAVTFVEQANGVQHVITTTTAASGSVSFEPADGPAGQRDVVAIVEQNGMPRTQLTVAHYAAAAPNHDRQAVEQLEQLERTIARARLDRDVARKLVTPIWAARRDLLSRQPDHSAVCTQLGLFLARVEGAEGSGMTADQADAWIDDAWATERLLGCS